MATRTRRFLMVHWDGAGNQPPQRALTRELVRRGHEVHVLTHNSVASGVLADGATFHSLATAHQYAASDRLPAEDEISFLSAKVWGSPAFRADFRAVADQVRPEVCLVDCMLVSVLDAALELSAPCVALHHMLYDPETWAPLMDPLIRAGSSGPRSFGGLLESLAMVMVFSYPELGPRNEFARSVEHVGPIREPAQGASWPRRYPDRPLVLVSLSTSFQNQHATLQRICDALALLPVEALVTLGGCVAPEEIRAGGGVELRTFVPHDQVLPSVDLIITHAGLGTIMAGAGAGVPMLCMPMGRDQNLNAGRVEALGLGRVLPPDSAPTLIGQTVLEMIEDQSLKTASRAFAARVRRFGDLMRAAELVENLR